MTARVRHRVHGGLAHFPALARPFEVDLRAVGADRARRLVELFDRAEREARARPAPDTAASADCRRHEVGFELDGDVRELTCSDGAMGPAQLELVAWLEKARADALA